MEGKSERTGKYLFLLLIVGLICSSISFVFSAIHAGNEDFYFNYIRWLDTSLALLNAILYLITVIYFLVWIYQVHSEFRQISTEYPITPGGALRRIMIPIYNIVGLWTVYSSMARFLLNVDDKTMRYGQRLMGLIPYYYFGQFIYKGLNRAMLRSDDPSMSLELWTTGLEIFVSLMYISMYVTINNGLRSTKEHTLGKQAAAEE